MTITPDDVKTMTERSLKKRLFLALQYSVAPEAAMMERIAEHLRYASAMECTPLALQLQRT